MPDGSSSAAPVVSPGPSTFQYSFALSAGFFMACSSIASCLRPQHCLRAVLTQTDKSRWLADDSASVDVDIDRVAEIILGFADSGSRSQSVRIGGRRDERTGTVEQALQIRIAG